VSFVFTIWKVIKTEQTYLHFVITVWFNRVEREQKQSADVEAYSIGWWYWEKWPFICILCCL